MERGGNNGTPGATPRTNPAGIRIVGMPARQAGPPALEQWTMRNLETHQETKTEPVAGVTRDRRPGVVPVPVQGGSRVVDLTEPPAGLRDTEAPAPRRTGRRRLLVALLVCLVLGGLGGSGLALADRAAARQQRAVVPVLDLAAAAATGVDTASRPLDPTRMVERLGALVQAQDRVGLQTGGPAWTLAAATTRRDDLAATGDRMQGVAWLAAAAGPLRESMGRVRDPDAGTPDRLDTLARDLNRYASATERARQVGAYPGAAASATPAGTTFEQLATAAALLPAMAGDEAPRTWTVCRSTRSGCTRFTLQDGIVGDVRSVGAAGHRVNPDIVVLGMSAAEMLTTDGGRTTWSVPAVLDLLVATDGGAHDGTPRVSSVVPVEQHGLTVIAGR
ncbi:hypothetical protein ACIB24_21225 [Spongisporangium articulatum]|uniref:Uncharacterized protein n=1 Tax=Spongisporangium articulatum TaxID=3362603 RepID=A0ABW8AUP6_9ACTN